VLVVSAGATANAAATFAIAGIPGGVGFIATVDTVNNGTVNLSGGASDNTTIDLSAVTGGTNGFNIVGGSSNAAGLDLLVGSQKADVINGGNTDQAAGAKDTLTGNGGADRFEFNVGVLNAATMAVATTTQGVDQEIITITAEADDNNEHVIVNYTLNTNTAVIVDVNLSAVNMGDAQAVATAIAEAIDPAAGITASAAAGVVTMTGDGGASLTINSITFTGTINPLSAVAGNGADVAQVTTLTLSGTPVNGDIYSVTASQVAGGGFTASATAGAGSTTTTIATALAGTFVLAGINDGALGAVVTFTDVTPDNGGFSLVTDTTAAFSGSGASDIGATALATADVITDFLSGTDKIDLNMVAGSGSNYVEAAAAADFTAARTAANLAFNGTTVQYYLTSSTADNIGLLFFDANLDGDVDGVVALTGVTAANFDAADIVA
jgi:hypothetical protein